MLLFMKNCVAEMMTQWEEARLFMGQWSDKAHILTLCNQIPDLKHRGEIDGLYQHFHLLNQGGEAATMLISSLKQGPQGGSSICGSGGSGGKKTKKVKKSKTSAANAASTASNANAGAAATAGSTTKCCLFYNSTSGCKYSARKCNLSHRNPLRASAEAVGMSQSFVRKGMTPSADFVTNSQ